VRNAGKQAFSKAPLRRITLILLDLGPGATRQWSLCYRNGPFVSSGPLAEPWAWADTGTSTARLMIAVLGGLADVERDLIRTRTAEGRSRAKGPRGQQMGRPPALTQGATLAELARSYNVGISNIRRATRAA
jgi:Resolvase, N terminal domain